jgi:hypothetical protein
MTNNLARTLRLAVLGLAAASLAACASAPAQPDLSAPSRKPADAKTQLESGRSYR